MAGKKDIVEQALKLIAGKFGDSLPMDRDNRMYRASEMGFDTTRRYYHLTNKDFNEFKLNADPQSHTGGGAIWLRDDPRYNISAHQVPSFEAEGAREIPLFIKPEKELSPYEWGAMRQEGKLNDQFPLMVTPEENKMLRDMGYSHATMGGETVVLDPKNLRSPHAAFDPNETESADYMKSNGGSVREGYANSGAVTDQYADEIASAKAAMAEKQYSEQPWSEWAGDVVGNAVNTAKAILPTALGGEGSVGVTDIARGAYEGAKDAVTFPGDVLTGKQALYDESGRPLEGAVGRSFNTVGAVGGASSVVPVPSNSLRVFGGTRSNTADKNALTKAQIMESQGADRDDIWRQTGWGRGAEGRWRYEMPDVGTVVDPSKFNLDLSNAAIPSGMKTTLSEYINHPELFDAYPEFKNMLVKGYYDPNSNVSGYYMPRYSRGTINPGFSDPYIALNLSHLPTVEAQRATLLHEIQHAIQQKEGFVPGTNVASRPLQTANPLHAFYKDALRTEPKLQELEALRATDEFKAEQAKKEILFAEFQKKIQELDEIQATTGVSTKKEYVDAVNDYMKKTEGKFPLAVKAARLGFDLEDRGIPSSEPPEFLDQEGAYLADAGEVESRNVQNRKDAPREELKERPPWRTQDKRYPYEGQLIDWNNTSWRKGYAAGGVADSDRDIESAMMIAGAI